MIYISFQRSNHDWNHKFKRSVESPIMRDNRQNTYSSFDDYFNRYI